LAFGSDLGFVAGEAALVVPPAEAAGAPAAFLPIFSAEALRLHRKGRAAQKVGGSHHGLIQK